MREPWASNGSEYRRPAGSAPPSRRDTEDMLAHVARSESESSDVYRRIEEQLRNVARRLEATERNQSENNRAMSKAASEINVAAREQAQAFDQLGGSVMSLADRLERVERLSATRTACATRSRACTRACRASPTRSRPPPISRPRRSPRWPTIWNRSPAAWRRRAAMRKRPTRASNSASRRSTNAGAQLSRHVRRRPDQAAVEQTLAGIEGAAKRRSASPQRRSRKARELRSQRLEDKLGASRLGIVARIASNRPTAALPSIERSLSEIAGRFDKTNGRGDQRSPTT